MTYFVELPTGNRVPCNQYQCEALVNEHKYVYVIRDTHVDVVRKMEVKR